jgi:hypothetical protein
MRAMEISVRQVGGLMGASLEVTIYDGHLKVLTDGVVRGSKSVDSTVRSRIHGLASLLVKTPPKVVRYKGPTISDSMETRIEIRDGGRHTTVKVASGDEAPDEVWDLIGTALGATQDLA